MINGSLHVDFTLNCEAFVIKKTVRLW